MTPYVPMMEDGGKTLECERYEEVRGGTRRYDGGTSNRWLLSESIPDASSAGNVGGSCRVSGVCVACQVTSAAVSLGG